MIKLSIKECVNYKQYLKSLWSALVYILKLPWTVLSLVRGRVLDFYEILSSFDRYQEYDVTLCRLMSKTKT